MVASKPTKPLWSAVFYALPAPIDTHIQPLYATHVIYAIYAIYFIA